MMSGCIGILLRLAALPYFLRGTVASLPTFPANKMCGVPEFRIGRSQLCFVSNT